MKNKVGQNKIERKRMERKWYNNESRLLYREKYGYMTFKRGRKGCGKGNLKEFISYRGRWTNVRL